MYFRFDEMLDQGSLNKALKVMPPDFSFIIDWHDFSSFTLRNPDPAKKSTRTGNCLPLARIDGPAS
jgi:hypothetical protein